MFLTNQPSRIIKRAAAASSNGLLNNLIAYWPLNEAGGANNALDLHTNGLTLTQNSSPGSDTGKVYAAARTFDGSADYFSRNSEAILQTGDVDWTVAAWIFRTGAGGGMVIGKDAGGSNREYYLYADASVTEFSIYKSGGVAMATPSAGGVTADTWSLLIAWHDAVNNVVGMQLNNGTPASAATTGAAVTSTAAFQLGARAFGGNFFPGRIGPVAMWKSAAGGGGVLSEAQRAAVWAGGAGLGYAGFTA